MGPLWRASLIVFLGREVAVPPQDIPLEREVPHAQASTLEKRRSV